MVGVYKQGVPKEWLNRSTKIERPFQAKMMMAKVEAINRTKNRRVDLVKLYKEDKEWYAQPNNDDTVNNDDGDDMGYESENLGKPWKNYENKK